MKIRNNYIDRRSNNQQKLNTEFTVIAFKDLKLEELNNPEIQ